MTTRLNTVAAREAPDDTAVRLSRLLVELAAAPSLPVTEGWEDALQPGDRLDRFEIRAVLGRGGFGTVYEGWDGELGRPVAIKTLRRVGVHTQRAAGAIKQEAEAVAKLNHPGIVTLHDVCQHDRGYYLVMERLDGETLAQRLRQGPVPWREALRIGRDIADALAHAHERGVLHRDLKPSNVYLCDGGRVKLLDFGLAHLIGSGSGESGGTPAYMAPEQARGEVVDARADVFALGIVLAEMLTGLLPFQAGEERGVVDGGPPLPLARVPARLAKLVRRMLARDPAARPADGAKAVVELEAFSRSVARRRRGAWLAGAVTSVVLAVVVALELQPPRLPPGRLVTVMADLDNRTGDATLDGFGALFGSALEQSRRVALVDRETLVSALTTAGGRPARVGEADAVAAARVAAAQLVIVPSLRPVRGGFELAVQVLDAMRGRSLLTARETAAAHQSLYDVTDRLAARVREALAEEASEQPRHPARVAEYAPANPEVLRLYAEGERLNAEYDYEGAVAKWNAAIARDPSFPLPRLSILQGLTGTFMFLEMDQKTALAHARSLRRDLPRLPEALRPWAEAVIVKVEDGFANHSEFVAALDRAIAARPEQAAPYIAAANELLLRRGDAVAARPYVDRAVEVSPLAGLGDVLDYLVLTERLDEALAVARRWTEKAPAPISFMNLSMVHSARGETAEALAVTRAARERWGQGDRAAAYVDADATEELDRIDAELEKADAVPRGWRWMDAEYLASRGRVRDAIGILDGGPAQPKDLHGGSVSNDSAGWWSTIRASVLLARSDRAVVARTIGEAIALDGPDPIHAWILAEAGEFRRARQLGMPAPDRLVAHRMARAVHDWSTGDREGALAELAATASPASDFYRGQFLAELGQHAEAVQAFRRYRRLRHGAFSTAAMRMEHLLLPRSLYLEAISLEALGERDAARELNGRLLRLWANADEDLPLLAQAKALERRLAAD